MPIRRQNGKCVMEGYYYVNMLIIIKVIGLSYSSEVSDVPCGDCWVLAISRKQYPKLCPGSAVN